jgi:thiol-disulfide isomerase/thioredoxin
MPRLHRLAAAAALLATTSLASCAASLPPPVAPVVAPAPPPPDPAAHIHALMINGGGNPNINFQPHLMHLRALRDTLLASGVHADHISIFASDGDDPAPDLVSRAPQPESDFWMLHDTRIEHPLETPRHLESSALPDVHLQPATKDALKRWFDAEAHVLQPGDTLLLYVTDHGNRFGPDPLTNTIQLWGKDQQLSVTELRDWIHELSPGVRVVSLMSQCFSGGFAALSETAPNAPRVCGYFSSTADRPAYGCFAENVGKERVGHSFHFIRALASSRHMTDAQAEVLADDDTPDVPLRSSDVFLDDLLHTKATEKTQRVEAFADELLGATWRDQPAWQADRAQVDRIAAAFGLKAPQSIADLEAQYDALNALGRRFDTSGKAWNAALSDATGDNLQGFLAANPTWNERLTDAALQTLPGDAARTLTPSLLGDLVPWTHNDKGDRLDTLQHRGEVASEGGYRTEVRIAATLRLRALLMSLAGRAYLDRSGTPAQRDDYAALRACEDVTLPGVAPPVAASEAADAGTPFASLPSIADDEKLEHDLHPAWIGIGFSTIRDDVRKDRGLPDGASLITGVVPDSPAKLAGIVPGDLILGTPGKPFTARNQVRAWTMLSPADQPETLEVARGKKHVELTITPRPYPTDVPQAAASGPEIGSPAPALGLHPYRGASVKLADGSPHLLLFWATWCKPCKASLPEAMAYERAHHTQIVAITDEPKATLDAFFKTWKKPFPKTVAMDDMRAAFVAYGVTGTPGFVLIDGKGIVRARATGYLNPPGLPIDGWKWNGK